MKREPCISKKFLLVAAVALSSSFSTVFSFSILPYSIGCLVSRQRPSTRRAPQVESPTKSLFSFSPFELNYYLPEEETLEKTLQKEDRKISQSNEPPGTAKVVLGLYRSQQDTVLCATDAQTGQVLMALSNERRIRQKNKLGDTKQFVEDCLKQMGLGLDAIETVVEHEDYERKYPSSGALSVDTKWEQWLTSTDAGANASKKQENATLLAPERMEVSRHLAQAYASASQAPFDSGLVVVMDHKGDSFRSMWTAKKMNISSSVNDFMLDPMVPCQPKDIRDKCMVSDWKEAESVYSFRKGSSSIDVQPIFKRFTPVEKLPPWASQQDQDYQKPSLGEVYSDAAKHLFGVDDPIGAMSKVDNLIPWINGVWGGKPITPMEDPILTGDLHDDVTENPLMYRSDDFAGPTLFDKLGENKEVKLESAPFNFESDTNRDEEFANSRTLHEDSSEFLNKTEESLQPRGPTDLEVEAIRLAHRIQLDTEAIVSRFAQHFVKSTGEHNICLAGSVACNAGLVNRLQRDNGLANTFVAPDATEQLAIGCSAFGLFGQRKNYNSKHPLPLRWNAPLPPFLGPSYSEREIREALDEASPWINIEYCGGQENLREAISEELEVGGIVAWFQGPSKLGGQSFGHRSILSSPSKKGIVRHLNERVRQRELFRSFGASVLADHVDQWFHAENDAAARERPFLDTTIKVREEKKDLIPAVLQPDGSTRVRTISPESDPLFHNILQDFHELTGLPLLLHTSFRTRRGEPLVETPKDAIGSFLSSEGAIDVLVLGDYIVRRRHPDLSSLVGETLTVRPVAPVCAGPVKVQTVSTYERSDTGEVATSETRANMPGRLTHNPNDPWVKLSDDMEGSLLRYCDGTHTLQKIMSKFTTKDDLELLTEAEAQELGQRVLRSLVKMYYLTLISW